MSESGIDGKLNGYAMNVANYLNANYPNNQISDIVGGRTIIWEDTPQLTTAIRFFSVLPADTTVNYYHTATINHGNIVNQTLTLPTVAARRLAMVYDQPAGCTDSTPAWSSDGKTLNFGTVCPGTTSSSEVMASFVNTEGAWVYTYQILNDPKGVFQLTGETTCVAYPGDTCQSVSAQVKPSTMGTIAGDNMSATCQVTITPQIGWPGEQGGTFPFKLTASVKPMTATLLLDDQPIAADSAPSTDSTIQVQVTHPYVTTAFNDPTPGLTYTVVRGGTYVFASEFGGSQSGQALRRTQGRLASMMAGGLSAAPQQKTIKTLNVIGQSWLRETTLNTALGAWATNTWYTVRHRIGLAGQNTSYYVDIRNQMGSVGAYSGTVGTGLICPFPAKEWQQPDRPMERRCVHQILGHWKLFEHRDDNRRWP